MPRNYRVLANSLFRTLKRKLYSQAKLLLKIYEKMRFPFYRPYQKDTNSYSYVHKREEKINCLEKYSLPPDDRFEFDFALYRLAPNRSLRPFIDLTKSSLTPKCTLIK